MENLSKVAIEAELLFDNIIKSEKSYPAEVIKNLLKLFNPKDKLIPAIDNKNDEIVEILLEDSRVDININKGYLLRKAIRSNNFRIFSALCKNPRTKLDIDDNYPIFLACLWERVEMIKMMLSNKNYNVVNEGFEAALSFLLLDERLIEIVKLFLDDKRLDPSTKNNKVLKMVIKNDRPDIAKLLLTYESVIEKSDKDVFIMISEKVYENKEWLELLKLLLKKKPLMKKELLEELLKKKYIDMILLSIPSEDENIEENISSTRIKSLCNFLEKHFANS